MPKRKLISFCYETMASIAGISFVLCLFTLRLQRWARAFQDSVYNTTVETTSGAKALNRLLKHQYLPRQKHMTLSHIISNITKEFLPDLHYKYIYKNFKLSDLYGLYNPAVIPSYIQGHPKPTILHCLHRQASGMVKTSGSGKFEVQGNMKTHVVDFGLLSGEPSCTCKDWVKYHIPCKHFFGVFHLFHVGAWKHYPKATSNHHILNLDAISHYVKNYKEQLHSPENPSTPHQVESLQSESKMDEM